MNLFARIRPVRKGVGHYGPARHQTTDLQAAPGCGRYRLDPLARPSTLAFGAEPLFQGHDLRGQSYFEGIQLSLQASDPPVLRTKYAEDQRAPNDDH